jgi:hypothetical protein
MTVCLIVAFVLIASALGFIKRPFHSFRDKLVSSKWSYWQLRTTSTISLPTSRATLLRDVSINMSNSPEELDAALDVEACNALLRNCIPSGNIVRAESIVRIMGLHDIGPRFGSHDIGPMTLTLFRLPLVSQVRERRIRRRRLPPPLENNLRAPPATHVAIIR